MYIKAYKRALSFVMALFLLTLFACESAANYSISLSSDSAKEIKSYKDIPNLSKKTIAAVEALKDSRKQKHTGFTFGAVSNTETFYTYFGEVRGYNSLLCERLSELFDIPFEVRIYTHEGLQKHLDEFEVDFTDAFVESDALRQDYISTAAVAQRVLKMYRLNNRVSPETIANAGLTVRLGFVPNGDLAFSKLNKEEILQGLEKHFKSIEIIEAPDYDAAYKLILDGKVDAFFDAGVAQSSFAMYKNVVSYEIFPLIYDDLPISAKNRELAPIIDALDAYINAPGVRQELREMYDKGYMEYLGQQLYTRLSFGDREELLRLQESDKPVLVALAYDEYPTSFYNKKENEWQGIAVDTLKQISEISGITFVAANEPNLSRADLINEFSGKDTVMAELMNHPERGGKFILGGVPYYSDEYALISKNDYPAVEFKQVPAFRVGLIKDSEQSEMFLRWFPNHQHITEYASVSAAFDGLEKGEVGLIMGSENLLLSVMNYNERPGFKINKRFLGSADLYFGFPLTQTSLRNIMTEAQLLADTRQISDNWTHKVFDYSTQMAKLHTRYIIAAASAIILLIIIGRNIQVNRQREYNRQLEDFNANLQDMVDEKTAKVMELQNSILITISDLVESRDGNTGGHIERTQRYLKILVYAMKARGIYKEEVDKWDIPLLLQSCQLHDVGKISVSDAILQKPGKLTEEEFVAMKEHSSMGEKIIEKIEETTPQGDFLYYAKTFAISHHEKWDGSGYPNRLAGSDIPLQGRIMAVADVYDALTSERAYKTPFSHETSVNIIKEGRGTHFDPVITDLFAEIHEEFEKVRRQIYG
ncbi:hypothetical protein AGMMS49975_06980 [Clostridia bacterium]|nr:hypothetical protein AGMMS49975_06980 [Clostridia bacterium]